MKINKNRPQYLEYEKPRGRERQYCCYKDSPCKLHVEVLNNLVRMFTGEIKADPKNLRNLEKI